MTCSIFNQRPGYGGVAAATPTSTSVIKIIVILERSIFLTNIGFRQAYWYSIFSLMCHKKLTNFISLANKSLNESTVVKFIGVVFFVFFTGWGGACTRVWK